MTSIAPVLVSVAFFLLSSTCSSAKGIPTEVPVKTIKTADGDIFDCVDMYKQPSLNHPLLKNHQILTKPVGVTFDNFENGGIDADEKSFQVELEDARCPTGTVPIHRVGKTDVRNQKRTLGDSDNLALLWATTEAKRRNHFGASARLNVYSVENVQPGQESSAMIGIKNENAPIGIQPEIRAGWKVAPALFGDNKTRLFVEWSADGGRTSCVNHLCPGFVQTNPNVYLGNRIWPVSTYAKDQYYIYLHIYKDGVDNWWVAFHDLGNKIGYWPRELFKEFGYASTPYFGGLVSCRPGEECPAMGNGHTPPSLPLGDLACRVERVQVIGPDFHWGGLGVHKRNIRITRTTCHDVGNYVKDVHAYRFTFGGPPCKTM